MVQLAEELAHWPRLAAQAAAAKKGDDTVLLDVGDVLAITDYFVITSAPNTRLVRTIVEEIERTITGAGGPKPVRIEGLDDVHWVLMDYGPFVVHVFLDETRAYYDLERLWADVPRVDWSSPEPATRSQQIR